MFGISRRTWFNQSRDPEGTRRQKWEKLMPLESQDEYLRDDDVRDVEVEISDDDLRIRAGSTEITTMTQSVMFESNEENPSKVISAKTAAVSTAKNSRKRAGVADELELPLKRQEYEAKGITDERRDETVQSLLDLLTTLPIQDDIPDLFERTARRLESNLFNKFAKDRSINALGRSSTLVTAGQKRDPLAQYIKEKNKLLAKAKAYVETATTDEVELGQVRQGEIWEIIKQVLDGDS